MTVSAETRPGRRIFGFAPSGLTAQGVVERVIQRRPPGSGVGLIVTPNIDHVARLRHDAAFAQAYRHAEIITCDGFPVYYYARMVGCAVPGGRVTGCEIAARLLREAPLAPWQRLFFAVDSAETEQGLRTWGERRGLAPEQIAIAVPPMGFERDPIASADLARRIAAHGTTILLMGVGAPKSEVFVDSHRARLPDCWALCIGQAVRIEAGTMTRAPELWQRLNLEWLWRVVLEPRRLVGRYATAAAGFLAAVAADLKHPERTA